MSHRGETEKYVAPKAEKNEYTLSEIQQSFKRGMITVLVVQAIVIGISWYFRTHTISETVNSLKSVSNTVVELTQNNS